jgi:hypothetical protein
LSAATSIDPAHGFWPPVPELDVAEEVPPPAPVVADVEPPPTPVVAPVLWIETEPEQPHAARAARRIGAYV